MRARGIVIAIACAVVPSAGTLAASPMPQSVSPLVASADEAIPDDVIPGEYVVMLRGDAGSGVRQQSVNPADLSERVDAAITRLDETLGSVGSASGQSLGATADPVMAELPVIDGFGARLSAAQAAVLATFEDVLSVEPNRRVEAFDSPTVSASVGPEQLPWGLDRIDQPNLPLNGTYAADSDGAGVTVYVIDAGVWSGHNEFSGRVIEPMIDFAGDFDSPDDIFPDCLAHGTHVAATIVGEHVGVAPAANVQGVRVIGCERGGSTLTVLRGMDWVAQHAQLPAVVNMSIGSPFEPAMNSAVEYLTARGISVVAAAGNDGVDACGTSPANVPSAITVGAIDVTDTMPRWSNFGSCVDLYAPGVDVVSAGSYEPDEYVSSEGTSMASPHVAGAAALYLSEHPSATPDAVERALVDAATVGNLADLPPGSPNRLLQVKDLPAPVNKPSTDPVAYITPPGGVGPLQVGEPVTLDGRKSLDPTGGALRFEWRIQGQNAVAGTQPTVVFTPNRVGNWIATLKVTNSAGASTTAVLALDVDDLRPPIAVLNPETDRIGAARGDRLSWDASESFDPDGGPLTYKWYYTVGPQIIEGDGPTFSQTYEGGVVDLVLEVTNEYGASRTATAVIFERLEPAAVIAPANASVSVGETVVFDGTASSTKFGAGDQLQYQWRDRPDGDPVSLEPTYRHTFDRVGTFTVWLTVFTPDSGEESTAKSTVVVSEVAPPVGPSVLSAVSPVRVLDTRASAPKVPGPKGAITAGGVARFTVGDIPLSAEGVVLNVTAANPSADGHLTVYPCGKRPDTSNVNYRAGVTTANAVVSLLGGQHELCVYSFASTDVVVDVTGFVPGGSAAHTVDPVRALDTRAKLSDTPSRLRAGGVLTVPIASVADVPADASAVFVNVTAANPSANGHLTVYRCGDAPGTSNVNYRAGATKANMAVVKLAADGSLCVKSHAETDVVVDVLGFVESGDSVALTATRKLDTRTSALGTRVEQRGPLVGGSMTKVKLDVDPARVAGVFLSVAAVNPAGDGHLTVFPCGKPPTASVLNYRAGVTTSNMVFSKVDQTGSVCVWTHATTDLVVDFNGSVAVPS